jgi:acetoin utilization deacetylase AcuC-like enzyme
MVGFGMTRNEFLKGMLGAVALFAMPGGLGMGENQKKKIGYLYDDIYLKHDTGGYHPERPERLTAINQKINSAKWYKDLLPMDAKTGVLETVSLVHDKRYIKKVEEECEAGYMGLSTGDTSICRESYSIALSAVGGVMNTVDAVFSEKINQAFCAVRPPGHHANQTRGMGFCVFNNIAIAARYAQKKYGIKRILIADWDVHHGNGTQDIFYEDDSVFFMSTHQYPWYPGTGHFSETGSGKGKGFTMNRPFSAGAGNEEIIGAFKEDLLPAAKKFKPEFTLISAGFDSRVGDPLGHFQIDDGGFQELTRIMLDISQIAGKGRLVSILEGGYSLEGLAAGVFAHIEELSRV